MGVQPDYPIASVDHALRLILLLQREGSLGVRAAADRLDVSPSTAHRLLAMLLYHGFAEQDPRRRYYPGPALQRTPHAAASVSLIRQLSQPHMEALVRQVDETVNLTILSGTAIHFLMTVESSRPLRVGDRTAASLPAHRTSGGKALLANLPEAELTGLYTGVAGVDFDALKLEIADVRRRGYAINNEQTEAGLTAVGVSVRTGDAVAPAAVSIAMPSARFAPSRLAGWVHELQLAARRIEGELARISPPPRPNGP